MSHTIGGKTEPLFLLLDDNYVTNPYANVDTTGWAVTAGTLIKGAAQEDAYGEFTFDYSYTTDFEAAYWEQDLGAAATGKTFMASFRAKSEVPRVILVEIVDDVGEVVVSSLYALTTSMQRILLFGDVGATVLTQRIRLKIYASTVSTTAQVFFDHVLFTEVLTEVEMPLPLIVSGDLDILKFQKELQGKNELWDGLIQEFGKKWRPHYLARWDYMDAATETLRQQIAASKTIFVIPHQDQDWGFHGMWDGNLERKYAFSRYIGHKGIITVKGLEFVYELPDEETVGEFSSDLFPPFPTLAQVRGVIDHWIADCTYIGNPSCYAADLQKWDNTQIGRTEFDSQSSGGFDIGMLQAELNGKDVVTIPTPSVDHGLIPGSASNSAYAYMHADKGWIVLIWKQVAASLPTDISTLWGNADWGTEIGGFQLATFTDSDNNRFSFLLENGVGSQYIIEDTGATSVKMANWNYVIISWEETAGRDGLRINLNGTIFDWGNSVFLGAHTTNLSADSVVWAKRSGSGSPQRYAEMMIVEMCAGNVGLTNSEMEDIEAYIKHTDVYAL